MSNFCKNCGRKIDNGLRCDLCEPNQSGIHQQQENSFNHNNTQHNSISAIEPTRSDKRLLNYVLDLVGIYAFAFSLGLLLAVIGESQIIDDANESLLGIGIFVSYYVFFEVIWQKTPGKWITKTKVVMHDGSKPSFGNVVGRSFARLIPFEPFSFFGRNPIGWHDKLSKTLVINDK